MAVPMKLAKATFPIEVVSRPRSSPPTRSIFLLLDLLYTDYRLQNHGETGNAADGDRLF